MFVLGASFLQVYSVLQLVICFPFDLCGLASHIVSTCPDNNIICLSFCWPPVYFWGWGPNVFSCPLPPPLSPLLTPRSSLPCVSLSGWNCGGGQLGLCRWPTSLPWWCSAMTRCPLAAVTIGDRQVLRVLLQTPLPSSWEVNYNVSVKLQYIFPGSVTDSDWVILVQEVGAEGARFGLSLMCDMKSRQASLFRVGIQTHLCFSNWAHSVSKAT